MRTRAVASFLFAGIATALLFRVRRGQTRSFDLRVLASLRGRGPRGIRKIGDALDKPVAVMLQAGAIGLLVARTNRRLGACIVLAPALALTTAGATKHLVQRARPPWHFLQSGGFDSFPSGHTAGKAALLWILANALPARPSVRALVAALAGADIGLVAMTRISDSVHWPTDTLAGAAIGIASAEALSCFPCVPAGAG